MSASFALSRVLSPVEKVALVAVGFAVAIRLAHLALVMPTPLIDFHREFVDSDMWVFDQWAQRLIAGDWLGYVPFHPVAAWQLAAAPAEKWAEWNGSAPTFLKAPFYAYLLAALGALNLSSVAVFALQALIAGLSGWLIFRITRVMFGEVAGAFAVAVFALYGPDIHFTTVMLRGPWVVLTTLVVTDRLLALSREPAPRRSFVAGLSIAAAIMVNEAMTPLVVLAPIALFASSRGARSARALKVYALMGAGLVAGMAPLVARNVVVGAPPFQLAVTGSVVMAVFNSSMSDPLFFSAKPEMFEPVMRGGGASLAEVLSASVRSFSSAPEWLSFYARKSAGLVAPFENPDNLNFYYVALVNPWLGFLPAYGFLLPLAVVGALTAWPQRQTAWWCVVPVSLTLMAAMMLTLPLSRYRATWAVHLIPLAGFTLSKALLWAQERRLRPLARVALGLAICATLQSGVQAAVLFPQGDAGRHMYRTSEFVLAARMEAAAGRFAAAAREIERIVELHPDPGIKAQARVLAADYRLQAGVASGVRDGR